MFKHKILRYLIGIMLFLFVFILWREYPKTHIKLLGVQRYAQGIQVNFQASKDFGKRQAFEINSILYCVADPKINFESHRYSLTGQEYMGLIAKTPAKFDPQRQAYVYQVDVDLTEDGLKVEAWPQDVMRCRVFTGRYVGGFLRSNMLLFQL